jgi:hypothetical protein
MRDSQPSTDALTALAVEARWRSIAATVVLPLILAGWVVLAVLAFGTLEMGLTMAQRGGLRRLPQWATVPADARRWY